MRAKIILLLLLSFYSTPSFCQQRLINCSSERNADNSISIFASSQAFGDYTVKLIFSSLLDYTTSSTIISNIALSTVRQGRTELIKLKNKTSGTTPFTYRYLYFPGRALRKAPDSSFIYLLPVNGGNNLRVSKVLSLAERLGQQKPGDFSGTGFIYKLGDTICAARAGFVYACNNDIAEGESSNDFYKSGRNKIHIQHKDGSLCTYDILAPIQLLVSPGDNIYPGKPLAIFNKQSEKYMVLFSTYYLDENKLLVDNSNEENSQSCFVYIPVHFYTGETDKSNSLQVNNSYTALQPKEIVAAELSKKDKKKLGL